MSLVAFHRDTLMETPFRRNTKKINVDAGIIWHDKTYRYEPNHAVGSYAYEGSIEMFRAPDTGVWREEVTSGYTYGVDTRGGYFEHVIDLGIMRAHFKAADWGEIEVTRRRFPGRFELRANRADNPDALSFNATEELRSLEGRLVIDERGFIRTLDVKTTWRANGSDETTRYIFSISDYDDVSVERPTWIETAVQRAPTARAEFVDNRQLIRLVPLSGNALEPETMVQLEAGIDNVVGRARLPESLEPGETGYVYRTSGGETGVAMGDRPSAVSLALLEEDMFLKVHRGGLDYFDELDVG